MTEKKMTEKKMRLTKDLLMTYTRQQMCEILDSELGALSARDEKLKEDFKAEAERIAMPILKRELKNRKGKTQITDVYFTGSGFHARVYVTSSHESFTFPVPNRVSKALKEGRNSYDEVGRDLYIKDGLAHILVRYQEKHLEVNNTRLKRMKEESEGITKTSRKLNFMRQQIRELVKLAVAEMILDGVNREALDAQILEMFKKLVDRKLF